MPAQRLACKSYLQIVQNGCCSPQSLKQEFLKKWMLGLKVCDSTKQNMSILERKNAIKLSADIAMASTRNGMTCWSRALVAKASKDNNDNKAIVEQISTCESEIRLKKVSLIGPATVNKRFRSKKRGRWRRV